MKNKIKFIIIVIIVFILLFLFLWFGIKRPQETLINNNLEINKTLINNEINVAPSTISAEDDKKIVQDLLSDSLKITKNENKDVSEVIFKDKEDIYIPLGKTEEALNIAIDPTIKKNLNQEYYSLFTCSKLQKDPVIGMKFELTTQANVKDAININDQAPKDLSLWEESIIYDMKNLLYPNESLKNIEPLHFYPTGYTSQNGLTYTTIRFADFVDENGERLSINYTFFNEQIFISNDRECLKKMIDLYQDEPDTTP